MKPYPDFGRCEVLVIGDIMLDRYYWGDVGRISPEAPVPIVRIREKTETLGGAGNVALNLNRLNCRCSLFAVHGRDPAGSLLSALIDRSHIRNCLVQSTIRPTTTKTRVIGHGQQLIRLDEEETGPFEEQIYRALQERFAAGVAQADAVVISDYGKGLFAENFAAEIIRLCRQARVPVFVDPKNEDWERYRGATCVTPNIAEFGRITAADIEDDDILTREAERVIDKYDLSCLLVTRGARGLSLIRRGQPGVHISTCAKEVFDVSGAGDTVVATLAAAFGAGLNMSDAAELANLAAGIVVGKVGTQPVTHDELQDLFYGHRPVGAHKISTFRRTKALIAKWRSEGKRIVFTNGCFEKLHAGHIRLLNAAAQEGERLVVGMNSDSSMRQIRGASGLAIREADRALILASLACVDLVVVFQEETPIELIRSIQPDVIVKGGDHRPETVVGHELVAKRGGKVVIVPLTEEKNGNGSATP